MACFDWAPCGVRELLFYENGKLMVGCSHSGCLNKRQTSGKGAILKKIEKGLIESLLYCRSHGGKNGKFSKDEIDEWPTGTKKCSKCLLVLVLSDFHNHSSGLFGKYVSCKQCRKADSRKHYMESSFEYTLYHSSSQRAKRIGIRHDIEISDIIIPDICPVLGVPIEKKRNSKYAPSLDQRIPRGGYTKENITVMSKRANILKNNMTISECAKIYEWMKNNT